MTLAAVMWALEQDLAKGPKLVLIRLAAHANHKGLCFPGAQKLKNTAGASERALREYLRELKRRRLISDAPPHICASGKPVKAYIVNAPSEALHFEWQRLPLSKPGANTAARQDSACRPAGARTESGNGTSIPSHSPNKEEDSGRANEDHRDNPASAFALFWERYPHPRNDPIEPARQAWTEFADGDVPLETILAAIEHYAADLRDPANSWRSAAQAKTWLREKRWQTAIASTPSQPAAATQVGVGECLFDPGVSVADRTRWQAALEKLARQEGEASVKSWLVNCLVSVREGRLVLQAPSRFQRDWLNQHWAIALDRAWGGPVDITAPANVARNKRLP